MKQPKKVKSKDMRKRFYQKRRTAPKTREYVSSKYNRQAKEWEPTLYETTSKSAMDYLGTPSMNEGVGSSEDSWQRKYREAYRKGDLKKSAAKDQKVDLKVSKNTTRDQRGDKIRGGKKWMAPGKFKVEEQVGSDAENMTQGAIDNDTYYTSTRRQANKYKKKADNMIRKSERDKWKRRKKTARKLHQTKFENPQEAEEFAQWRKKLPSNLQNLGKDYDLVQAWKSGQEPTFVSHDEEFRSLEKGRQEAAANPRNYYDYTRPDWWEEKDGKLGAYHLGSRNPDTGEYLKSPRHHSTLQAAQHDNKEGEIYIAKKGPFGRKKVYSGTEEDPAKIEGKVVKQGNEAMKYLNKQNKKPRRANWKKSYKEGEMNRKFATGGMVTQKDVKRANMKPFDNPDLKIFTNKEDSHLDITKRTAPQMAKSGIHIKPENRGKFNALKKRTGKSTEQLTHSKNPLTRKRAIFAQNAKKWNKAKNGLSIDASQFGNMPVNNSAYFDKGEGLTAAEKNVGMIGKNKFQDASGTKWKADKKNGGYKRKVGGILGIGGSTVHQQRLAYKDGGVVKPHRTKEDIQHEADARRLKAARIRPRIKKAQKAKNGITIKQAKDRLAKEGRGGDTEFVHVNKAEKAMLKRAGGSGTTNPKTGHTEYVAPIIAVAAKLIGGMGAKGAAAGAAKAGAGKAAAGGATKGGFGKVMGNKYVKQGINQASKSGAKNQQQREQREAAEAPNPGWEFKKMNRGTGWNKAVDQKNTYKISSRELDIDKKLRRFNEGAQVGIQAMGMVNATAGGLFMGGDKIGEGVGKMAAPKMKQNKNAQPASSGGANEHIDKTGKTGASSPETARIKNSAKVRKGDDLGQRLRRNNEQIKAGKPTPSLFKRQQPPPTDLPDMNKSDGFTRPGGFEMDQSSMDDTLMAKHGLKIKPLKAMYQSPEETLNSPMGRKKARKKSKLIYKKKKK